MAKGRRKSLRGGADRVRPVSWTGSTHYSEQKNFGAEKPIVGGPLLDAIAEAKLLAGYDHRHKKCPACGVMRSRTNKCWCNEDW